MVAFKSPDTFDLFLFTAKVIFALSRAVLIVVSQSNFCVFPKVVEVYVPDVLNIPFDNSDRFMGCIAMGAIGICLNVCRLGDRLRVLSGRLAKVMYNLRR